MNPTDSNHASTSWPALRPIARGVALFLGGFTLAGLIGRQRAPEFDANLWWVDLRVLPSSLAVAILLVFALLMLAFAVKPTTSRARRQFTRLIVVVLLAMATLNSIVFLSLAARGRIHAGFAFPASTAVALGLAVIYVGLPRREAVHQREWPAMLATALACAVVFPVMQVWCFGKTDYRRPADVVVVFGARVYADGRLSQAVADRVETACQLYHQGLTRRLIFSGGPGDGAIHETEAMRWLALRRGVPDEALLVDPLGLSTAATVRNTTPLFARLGARRVLAVSEFFHLPRIKLAYARAGQEVYTVPARPSHWLRGWPLQSILREVPAFWAYYARAVSGRITPPDAT